MTATRLCDRRRFVGNRCRARCCSRAASTSTATRPGSEVGGNWRYLNDNGMSSAYKSLHINTSRQIMEYKAFPMSRRVPDVPEPRPDRALLRQLRRPLRLSRPDPVPHRGHRGSPPTTAAGTSLSARATRANEQRRATTRCSSRTVITGTRAGPSRRFPAPTPSPARRLHSHDYKTFDGFEGKRVLVLGIGNSACDIAVETSKVVGADVPGDAPRGARAAQVRLRHPDRPPDHVAVRPHPDLRAAAAEHVDDHPAVARQR